MASRFGAPLPWDGLPRVGEGAPDSWKPAGEDGYVCSNCVANEALVRVWASAAHHGLCVFCNRRSEGGVRSVHQLITYIYRSLRLEYGHVGSSSGTHAGGSGSVRGRPWSVGRSAAAASQAEIPAKLADGLRGTSMATLDVLRLLGESVGPGLSVRVARSITRPWRPLHSVIDPIESQMMESWQNFARTVRSGPRFGFSGGALPSNPHGVDEVLRFFEESVAHIETRVVKILDPATNLYRARIVTDGPLTTADQLGSPPVNKAGPQRMSAAGVSCFYAAEDPVTAEAEVRAANGSPVEGAGPPVAVGEWGTRVPFRYLELSQRWEMPSILDPAGRSSRRSVRFVRDFEAEISKPRDEVIGDANSYLPTQIFAEYLRYALPTQYGQGVEAIRYRSDARPGGVNWCFFGQPDRKSRPTIEFLGLLPGPSGAE